MIEFLRKFENRGIKMFPGNSILITNSIDLHLFALLLYGVVVRCDRRRFSVLSPLIKKSVAKAIVRPLIVTLFACIYTDFTALHFHSFCSPSSSLSLPHYTLSVTVSCAKCQGELSCTSSTFSTAILNEILFFHSPAIDFALFVGALLN